MPLSRSKIRDYFSIGAIATFPLLVPPFFIPHYSASLGFSFRIGAVLAAIFNVFSAVSRLASGFSADHLGPLNTRFVALFLTTASTFVMWPLSKSVLSLPFSSLVAFQMGHFLYNPNCCC